VSAPGTTTTVRERNERVHKTKNKKTKSVAPYQDEERRRPEAMREVTALYIHLVIGTHSLGSDLTPLHEASEESP
jgi:hypothetical protein